MLKNNVQVQITQGFFECTLQGKFDLSPLQWKLIVLLNTSLKNTIGEGILSQISFQINSVFTKCSTQ